MVQLCPTYSSFMGGIWCKGGMGWRGGIAPIAPKPAPIDCKLCDRPRDAAPAAKGEVFEEYSAENVCMIDLVLLLKHPENLENENKICGLKRLWRYVRIRDWISKSWKMEMQKLKIFMLKEWSIKVQWENGKGWELMAHEMQLITNSWRCWTKIEWV